MRKILLFIVAAIMAATNMWAEFTPSHVTFIDSVPMPRYLTNFNYDIYTGKLSFTDNYCVGTSIQRRYDIDAYVRNENTHLYKYTATYETYYDYGYKNDNVWETSRVFSKSALYTANDSEGGDISAESGLIVYTPLSEVIEACMSKGYTSLRIVVDASYATIDGSYIHYNSGQILDAHKLYLNNYFDLDIPNPLTFELTSPASTVKYGENIELNCAVQAAGQARVVFSESDQPDGDQRVIYDYTLSASEAGAGKVVSYHKSFIDDDMPATRYYHVVLWLPDGKAGEQSTSLNFQYPLTINSGTPAYYSPGEQITVPKSDCGSYSVRTVNNVPVYLEDLGANYRLTMPSCAVWLNEQPTQYTVQFRDYDNSVLKTEKVLCGHDATAPTPPTHAGMTFNGWDKPYTNIRASQVIRARYSYDGVETLLTYSHEIAKPGDDVVFGMKVKTPSPVSAQATLQAAWLDDENDELNFGDIGYKYTYTAEEAAAGTSATKVLTVLPTGSLNYGHRARYFRMRVRLYGSSNDIYSNIVRVATYYPILISSPDGKGVAESILENGERLMAGNNGTIYSRPLDTIYATVVSRSCFPKFEWQRNSFHIESGNTWVVVPAGSGENMLTISREKHQVLFYMEGHHDGYWNLIHGEGVYEPQEITCGEAATPPDIIAEVPEGKLFRGWKARGEYADDAYNYVIRDMIFDALLEDNPEGIEQIPVPQDNARKYMINGQIYIALPDGKVFDVRGLRVR